MLFVLRVYGYLHIEISIYALLWNAYSPLWMITKITQASLHKKSIHKFTFLCCLVGKHAAAYVHVRVLWVTQLNHTKQIHLPEFFHRKCIIQGRFCWNFWLLVHDFMLQPSRLSNLFPNLDVLECLAKRLLGQWFRGDVPGAGENLKGCRFWICEMHKSTTRFFPGCPFLGFFRGNGNVVRCLDQYFFILGSGYAKLKVFVVIWIC